MVKSAALLTVGLLLLLAYSAQAVFKNENVTVTSVTYNTSDHSSNPFAFAYDSQNAIIYTASKIGLKKINAATMQEITFLGAATPNSLAFGSHGLLFVPAASPYVARGYQAIPYGKWISLRFGQRKIRSTLCCLFT